MVESIKKLREMTGFGIADCKKALTETGGDFNKALEVLRERGAEIMAKKSERVANQGLIDAYVHFSQSMAALVEVNCETDFVAKSEDFKKFVKDLVMHIAAVGPKYISRDNVPAEDLAGKTDEEKEEYLKETCLLEQAFVKNPKMTIGGYLQDITGRIRENIKIRRFIRYTLGE